MISLTINIDKLHSFADIITNSSTEVFITADTGTRAKIYNLVNSLFQVAGSDKKFDDVFNFEYDLSSFEWYVDDKIDEEFWNEDGTLSEEGQKLQSEMLEEARSDNFDYDTSKHWQPSYDSERPGPERKIKISVREGLDSDSAKQAADLLTKLSSFFTTIGYSNY